MSLQDQVKVHSETGGSTFGARLHNNLAGRSFYSVVAHSEFSRTVKGPVIILEHLKDVMFDYRLTLSITDNYIPGQHTLSTWYDAETDISYIEIASLFQDRDAAIEAGRANNQKAIYDLRTGTVIFID